MSWNWKENLENYVAVTYIQNQSENVLGVNSLGLSEIEGSPSSPCTPSHTEEQERIIHQSAKISQPYDHTPIRWRNICDILAQCNLCIVKLEKYEETAQDKAWIKAMEEKLSMIDKNGTWELVDRPSDKQVIGVKWVFRTKLNLDGSVQKNKARLVAKGYVQKPGIDYNETFAQVARFDTIRTLIALAAQRTWKLYQLDVKSVFLNGKLQEKVYVDQLEGFVLDGKEDKVYRFHKALYGLKHAPRAWYGEIDNYLIQCGFEKSLSEATLYTKTRGDKEILIVSIYVDNIVYTGSNEEMLKEFKEDMQVKYEMTDLGLLHHFLGMGVIQTDSSIFIHQRKYAASLLDKFALKECKSVSIPLVATKKLSKDDGSGAASEEQYRKIVGNLLYLTATRPDVMYAASLLIRYMHCPTNKHYGTTKRVLRYVKETLDYGLKYEKGKKAILIRYCDSDWGGSIDDSKSTSSYAFSFRSGVFSWASIKQNCVALSTTEAKYISASKATTRLSSSDLFWRILGNYKQKQLICNVTIHLQFQ
ncbi:unnamed protein product [Prunus armeniaca]